MSLAMGADSVTKIKFVHVPPQALLSHVVDEQKTNCVRVVSPSLALILVFVLSFFLLFLFCVLSFVCVCVFIYIFCFVFCVL